MTENQELDFQNFFNTFKTLNKTNPKFLSIAGDDQTRLRLMNELEPFFKMFYESAINSCNRIIEDKEQLLFETDLERNALRKRLDAIESVGSLGISYT